MTESSKRRRVNSSPFDISRSESPLTCVRVVCQNGPDILILPHIVGRLVEFLDNSGKWTLPKACASGSPYLVEQLLLRHAAEASSRCWYHPDYRQWQFDTCLEEAAKVENLKIVQLLDMNFRDCCVSKDFLESTIRRGLSDIVMWLVENGCNVNWDAETVLVAIRSRHLELAKWLKGRINTTIANEMTEWAVAAASKGDLVMVKGFSFTTALFNAANNGFLDIVKLLHVKSVHYSCARAMDGAASNGHLDIVKWLDYTCDKGCTVDAMDNAAANGCLHVVQWLHENRTEGCTTSAMDEAASSGNLEMVKWLHFNRSEGCTTNAMDSAAAYGHLDVVKWLHVNRSEGCTTEAMDNAARHNHLDVLQWLDQNRTEGFTSDARDNAVSCGNWEVYEWLIHHRPELCRTAMTNTHDKVYHAARFGHFNVVWFLYLNYCSINTLRDVFKNDFMSLNLTFKFAGWAYIHHRDEFELNIAGHLFAD